MQKKNKKRQIYPLCSPCFFMILSLFSLPLSPHFPGLHMYGRGQKALGELATILCADAGKSAGRPARLLTSFPFSFTPCVTQLPFHQAPRVALPLASASLCPSTCQKLLSLHLTSPACHLGLHLSFPGHEYSQADHSLGNNIKHTEDLQIYVFSSASVLNSRTPGR